MNSQTSSPGTNTGAVISKESLDFLTTSKILNTPLKIAKFERDLIAFNQHSGKLEKRKIYI